MLTHAEMVFHRDVSVPAIVNFLAQARDRFQRMMARSEEARFQLRDQYFGISNSLKAFQGHLDGLRDAEMLGKIKERDEALIARSGDDVGEAFEFISAEMAKLTEKYSGDRVNPQQMMPDMQRVASEVCGEAKSTINKARFEAYGTDMYPDATFTLRLAYGTVEGYEAGTTLVAPKTTFNGLYERNQGMGNEPPFNLPQKWLDQKGEIDLDTPYNFVCTADIIGGNSGSPVLNRNAEVVGLIFDGNIESLPGNYWFDGRVNRAVSVHTGGMMEAIEKFYGEAELIEELRGSK